MAKKLSITGIRGIPAAHGGFETFAEYLALYLVKNGWEVTVYCQIPGDQSFFMDEWQGVRRVHIPAPCKASLSTVMFDIKTALHVLKDKDQLNLTLGYNTGFLNGLYRLRGIKTLVNMDGIEWKRAKWSRPVKAFFYLNERLASRFANQMIADHPEIKKHLSRKGQGKKITCISYGAPIIETADSALLQPYNITPKNYAIAIGRIEPENSVLEIVSAWSRHKRGKKLVVLGDLQPGNAYHQQIKACASEDVLFPGAIYDQQIVQALRFYSYLYLHGHTVGGTNPSLLEALGAGNPVLAHDNNFNRWVTDNKQCYFKDTEDCVLKLDTLLKNEEKLADMAKASQQRHREAFLWGSILPQYETLLEQYL